jgi:hypothetical protein
MNGADPQNLTPYSDVNGVLARLAGALAAIFGERLVGLYLTGSLTYGDFDPASSDIDFVAVLMEPMAARDRHQVKAMHERIGAAYPVWKERIEGSYVTTEMLASEQPPRQPRPYFNGGDLWEPDPVYGQEWIMNGYVLHERGIAIVGPDPKTVFRAIGPTAHRRASIRSLHDQWEPLLTDASILRSSHHQAYATLSICRILYSAENDGVASKRVASQWATRRYGEPWRALIAKAEKWHHGEELDDAGAVLDFIRFALREVADQPRSG